MEVFGERSDGYHALRSVVLPITLADDVTVEATDDGCIAGGAGFPNDLTVRAAFALREALVVRGDASAARLGARIAVEKRIPAGGGLGGGSADAAAVLRALNALWRGGLSPDALAAVGARVGSDVPALVFGGPVLMEGRGETVAPLPPLRRALHLALVDPGVPVSTRDVYAACVPRMARGATDAMAAALAADDFDAVVRALSNDLEEPARRICPPIAAAIDALRGCGAAGVQMSGSGSCAFGLFPDGRTAEGASEELVRLGFRACHVSSAAREPAPCVASIASPLPRSRAW